MAFIFNVSPLFPRSRSVVSPFCKGTKLGEGPIGNRSQNGFTPSLVIHYYNKEGKSILKR